MENKVKEITKQKYYKIISKTTIREFIGKIIVQIKDNDFLQESNRKESKFQGTLLVNKTSKEIGDIESTMVNVTIINGVSYSSRYDDGAVIMYCSSPQATDLGVIKSLTEAYDITTITSLTVNNLIAIEIVSFCKFSNLTNVNMPDVISVGYGAFLECENLKSIYLPKVKSIGNSTFWGCKNLMNVEISEVTSIGDAVFGYCESLESISLSKVTKIGEYGFYSCKNLRKIEIPKVTSIDCDGFSYCESLTSIFLPKVVSIEKSAFCGCTSLEIITLLETVKMLNTSARELLTI